MSEDQRSHVDAWIIETNVNEVRSEVLRILTTPHERKITGEQSQAAMDRFVTAFFARALLELYDDFSSEEREHLESRTWMFGSLNDDDRELVGLKRRQS